MPAYTLGELMSQATWRAGRRSDLSASHVSFLANEAYMEVAQAVPHAMHEKIAISSTTSGENRITLPVDFAEPIHFSLLSVGGSARTLAPIGVREADAYQVTRGGTPSRYALYANWVELWPSPNSSWSVQLRYRSQVSDLVELTDTPSMSTPWRAAVLTKLVEKVHEAVGDAAGAAAAQQRYLAQTATLKNDEAKRQSSVMPLTAHVIY